MINETILHFSIKRKLCYSKCIKLVLKLKIQKLELNKCHQLIFIKELEPFWKSTIVF